MCWWKNYWELLMNRNICQWILDEIGKEFLIYLSHVFWRQYIENDDMSMSALKVYSVNTLFASNSKIYEIEKHGNNVWRNIAL